MNKTTELLLLNAMERGYKYCETGINLEKAKFAFIKLIRNIKRGDE